MANAVRKLIRILQNTKLLCIMANWILKTLYFIGVIPHKLKVLHIYMYFSLCSCHTTVNAEIIATFQICSSITAVISLKWRNKIVNKCANGENNTHIMIRSFSTGPFLFGVGTYFVIAISCALTCHLWDPAGTSTLNLKENLVSIKSIPNTIYSNVTMYKELVLSFKEFSTL